MKTILRVLIVVAAAAIVSLGWYFFSQTSAAQSMNQNPGGGQFSGGELPDMSGSSDGGRPGHHDGEWVEGAEGMPERGEHGSQGGSFSGIWQAFASSFVKLILPTAILTAIVIAVQWIWRRVFSKRKPMPQL